MVSFDVKSLFTNIPLDRTINIILKRIYDDNELRISISKNEMKELLLLWLLLLLLLIELEKAILPQLTKCIKYWRRNVYDTISFVKLGSINYIITKLNSFDKNIQFTFEEEGKGTLPFLDILIQRNGNSIMTTIFRKPTNNAIYLNWNAFAPDTWKRGT